MSNLKNALKYGGETKRIDSDVGWRIDEDIDGLFTHKAQDIPDEWLTQLRHEREASKSVREGNYMKAASIPVAVVEHWLTQGFDIHKESAKSILKRLRAENLDAFITTNKQI